MIHVIEELRALVAYPTVSTSPVTAIAAHLAQRCADAGFTIERFDDPSEDGKTNIVATIGPTDAAPGQTGGLVISGHMDVVPTVGQPWTSDPFVLTARGSHLQARGTADMKGFIAATMCAIERIEPREYTRPLILIWTHDEEVGCHGSAHLARTFIDRGRGLPRDCLIGEPTDFRVLRMHAGHVAGRITATGAAAHSAFPEKGANAIEAAAMAVAALRDLAVQLRGEQHPQADLERDFVPLNVGTISGGSAANIVPDACVIEFGFRPLPGGGHEALWRRITEQLGALQLPPGTALTNELIRVTPSLCTPATTPLAAELLIHSAEQLGHSAEQLGRSAEQLGHADDQRLGAAAFATDGGNLARCGAEPLVFGPGSILVAHRADEFIEEQALHRTVAIVERVIRSRCCVVAARAPSS